MFCAGFFHARKTFLTFFQKSVGNHASLDSVMRKEGDTNFCTMQKGGVMMKPTSFEDAIRLQFDTLMKKVIDGAIKNYERELKRRNRHEIPFCELPPIMVATFAVNDKYELETTVFQVNGEQVLVDGEELCNALKQLSERKRNILLMRYFMEMSDIEIAEILNISDRTSLRNRKSALQQMKEILEKGE